MSTFVLQSVFGCAKKSAFHLIQADEDGMRTDEE